MRRTKIVCTIGPASADDGVLRQMIRAGMDVARLNFSHGDLESHARNITLLRRVASEEGANLAILMDLQGPRLRTGPIGGEHANLVPGQTFTITSRSVPGNSQEISVEGIDLAHEVGPGNTILIEDGLLELSVLETTDTDVICRVVVGGPLRSRKGINVPGVTLSVPTITDKDRSDLAFGVKQRVDFVALSFVRAARDVNALRRHIEQLGGDQPIIAKIEKHEAVAAFDSILAAADGIMVARGDLGVETSAEEVPIVQKMAIAKCNAVGKPVITATQMLNSMIESARPTRAEASDVANAILDGTDAVMLSGETSIGQYPVLTVKTMARIAVRTEGSEPFRELAARRAGAHSNEVADAIAQATVEIASEAGAKAILTMTASGYTARMVASHRPAQPIVGITSRDKTMRRLALTWGVQAELVPDYTTVDELFVHAEEAAKGANVAAADDLVVITAGLPIGFGGRTNLINVHKMGESLTG
ncbi:MAG: pyruvate kinase [Chloroflexota bacterium]